MLLPIPRAAVQVLVDQFFAVEPIADDRQEGRELREDEGLVPFVDHLAKLLHEHVELGAGFVGGILVDQARMNSRLPQAEQRFQDVDLRLFIAFLGDPIGEHGAVVGPQFVVRFAACLRGRSAASVRSWAAIR